MEVKCFSLKVMHLSAMSSEFCLPSSHYRGKVTAPQHVNLILVWVSQFKSRAGFNIANQFREAKMVSSSTYLCFFCLRERMGNLYSVQSPFQKLPLFQPIISHPYLKVLWFCLSCHLKHLISFLHDVEEGIMSVHYRSNIALIHFQNSNIYLYCVTKQVLKKTPAKHNVCVTINAFFFSIFKLWTL